MTKGMCLLVLAFLLLLSCMLGLEPPREDQTLPNWPVDSAEGE